MGHCVLVAYERTDGQYTLHYSHWGAANLKLKHRISAETPFGGDDTERAKCEVKAEGVAYVIRRCCGLDMSGSAFYLAVWESDEPEVVRAREGFLGDGRHLVGHTEILSPP